MLNKIILMGRLTRDPELRRTQSGTAVTSFSIACDRDFAKGRMAVVEGRLQIRDWTDREGGKRRSAEVVADNVYFGDSKRDSGGEYGGSSYGALPAYGAPASSGRAPAAGFGGGSDFAEIGEEDGELPF